MPRPTHEQRQAPPVAPAHANAARLDLRAFWGLALALALMCAVILLNQPNVEGVRQVIRSTARTSLVFFSLAYGAQALHRMWPGPAARWVRQQRRVWGWLFVVSHTLHAGGIAALGVLDPALFAQLSPLANRITGGLAYVILWAMGVSSFDRTARWLGRPAWSRLHTWGSHYLWLSFVIANGKRVPHEPWYVLPVALLLLIQGLRWWSARATGPGKRQAVPAH